MAAPITARRCRVRGLLLTVSTLAASLAGPLALAAGEAAPAQISMSVRIDDVDHSQPAGAQVLYARFNASAQLICEQANGSSVLRHYVLRLCRERAVAAAIERMDCDTLRAIHRARYRPDSHAS